MEFRPIGYRRLFEKLHHCRGDLIYRHRKSGRVRILSSIQMAYYGTMTGRWRKDRAW